MDIGYDKKTILEALKEEFHVYPESFKSSGDLVIFILRDSKDKYLGVSGKELALQKSGLTCQQKADINLQAKGHIVRIYDRNDKNLKVLLSMFPELKPSALGRKTSFGFGDRLGNANAAHIRVIKRYRRIIPILAQQSIRELIQTGKDFKKVISNSIWNILQEGYEGRWGADADHIKNMDSFTEALDAGMTMYTLDTSDHLDLKVPFLSDMEIRQNYDIESSYIKNIKKEYIGKEIQIGDVKLKFNEEVLVRLALLYGNALRFVLEVFKFLKTRLKDFDYEISFDETGVVTSPEAHYFLVNEMQKMGIIFTSLALKFPGTFEKGIDYIGDLKEFEKSINIHNMMCRKFGGYKLSLHSGSDKLSIYRLFARNTDRVFHIKTSGTSWLEALRVAAFIDPAFFRELYLISLDSFDDNKRQYHTSLNKDILHGSLEHIEDKDLPSTVDDYDIRRVFHIAYGAILKNNKEKLMKLLFENEDKYYKYLIENFNRHFKNLYF